MQASQVIVPWANRKGVELEVLKDMRTRIQFVFSREALNMLPWCTLTPIVESRL